MIWYYSLSDPSSFFPRQLFGGRFAGVARDMRSNNTYFLRKKNSLSAVAPRHMAFQTRRGRDVLVVPEICDFFALNKKYKNNDVSLLR